MIELRIPEGDGPLEVLCLGAHADDIEIGCGGTLLQLAASRTLRVRWIVFSGEGERGAEAEASAAAFLAGVADSATVIHAFRDGHFPSARGELKDALGDHVAAMDPDVVFTHDERDLHQDHRTLGELTREALRDHFVLGYEIPKFDGGLRSPNVFVPLDESVRRRKIELLMERFPSQRTKRWFSPETFDGLMRLRGVECAAPSGYAEGFHGQKVRLGA